MTVTQPMTADEALTNTPLIRLRDLGKTYGGSRPYEALREGNLDVAQGEMLAIVGPSGSGKSTLLNILGLLDSPSTGSYQLCGRETRGMVERERTQLRAIMIGFVFQSFELMSHRTVLENVMLAGLYLGVSDRDRRHRAVDAIASVGLERHQDSLPRTMSGGERQRVAIARGIAASPSLLLCDEPTGNLDSENSVAVMELLRALNEEGVSVLVITHDQAVAEYCRRQVVIRDGLLSERSV